MASFSAYLTVGTFKTWLNALSLNIHQEVDDLGRPHSMTHGGKLTLAFNATRDPTITAWMVDPAKQLSGFVTFLDDVGRTLKTLDFTNAYCVDMEENFDGTANSVNMVTTIIISPEKISVGQIPHDNNWPPIEAHN